MLNISSETLALVISTFVNIILAFVTVYQVRTDKKLRIEERQLRMQYEAYMRYFQEFSLSENVDTSNLFAATTQAMLVSSPENAEKIISLTSKYSQYLDHPNDKDELNKMAESLIELERILHKELIMQKASTFVRLRNNLSRLIKRKAKQ